MPTVLPPSSNFAPVSASLIRWFRISSGPLWTRRRPLSSSARRSCCTLLIPDRTGNKLIFGLQNILANPQVGIIFLVPGTEETLRVNGTAALTADPIILERLSARSRPALVAIRVTVQECFFHCAKAFKRSQLWRPETWPQRQPISFGKLLASKVGGDEAMAQQIDQVVEEDYKNNL